MLRHLLSTSSRESLRRERCYSMWGVCWVWYHYLNVNFLLYVLSIIRRLTFISRSVVRQACSRMTLVREACSGSVFGKRVDFVGPITKLRKAIIFIILVRYLTVPITKVHIRRLSSFVIWGFRQNNMFGSEWLESHETWRKVVFRKTLKKYIRAKMIGIAWNMEKTSGSVFRWMVSLQVVPRWCDWPRSPLILLALFHLHIWHITYLTANAGREISFAKWFQASDFLRLADYQID